KVRAVLGFAYPRTLKALERFVGLINYLQNTIPHAAQLVAPLQALKTDLLKPAPFKGRLRKTYAVRTAVPDPTPEQKRAFELCKAAVALNPKQHHFNSDHHVYVYIDASKEFGFAAVGLQSPRPIEGYPTPDNANIIFNLSKRLTKAELNYWITELEIAGLCWFIIRARHVIESVKHRVTIFTDHKAIGDLLDAISMKSSSLVRQNQRLVRACLFLNQFKFDLKYVPGHLNVLADALSR
ncbi:DNA/RNA polymerase, partial [Ascobolus immersus RN42]